MLSTRRFQYLTRLVGEKMNEAPATEVSTGPTREELDRIASFFISLDKVIRGLKLYEGQGQLVDRLLDDLEQKAAVMVKKGDITVRIASFGVIYRGKPVSPDETRNPYLFRLFCDGVRELTVQDGVTREELRTLAEVLGSDVGGDDDLVTTLWQKNLEHLRYYAADTLTAGLEVDDDGELTIARSKSRGQLRQDMGANEIALSPDDIRMLGGEGSLEWLESVDAPIQASGKVARLAARIRESFQTPRDVRRFVSLAIRFSAMESGGAPDSNPMVVGLWDALLAKGNAGGVADLLDTAIRETASPSAGVRAAAAVVLKSLSVPERFTGLAGILNDKPQVLLPMLKASVEHTRSGQVALLSVLGPGPAQDWLHEILEGAGVDLTPFYAEKLDDPDEAVVTHAIKALAGLGTAEAVRELAKGLARNSTPIRKAALEGMLGKYDPAIRMPLARALRDPSTENRLLALKVISGSGDNRFAWALLSAVQDNSFPQKDSEEQAAFYNALASFHDDRTVSHFKGILSRKNLMRNKVIINLQLMAVRALAEVGTEQAMNTLRDFKGYRYHGREVRDALDSALTGRKAR